MKLRKARLRAKGIAFGRTSWQEGGHHKCEYGWAIIGVYDDGRKLYQRTCWRHK